MRRWAACSLQRVYGSTVKRRVGMVGLDLQTPVVGMKRLSADRSSTRAHMFTGVYNITPKRSGGIILSLTGLSKAMN